VGLGIHQPHEVGHDTRGIRRHVPLDRRQAMEIEHSKMRRVTSAVDAAASAAADLSAQYLDQMSAEDQRRMTAAAAFLGAVNLSRSIAKMEVRKLSQPKS
jgi:hypothetical protein